MYLLRAQVPLGTTYKHARSNSGLRSWPTVERVEKDSFRICKRVPRSHMPSRWDSFGIIFFDSTDMPPLAGLVAEMELVEKGQLTVYNQGRSEKSSQNEIGKAYTHTAPPIPPPFPVVLSPKAGEAYGVR